MQIVVSRFNENLDWTKQLHNVIIYNKGDHLENSVPLPNVGREGHSYYTHIYNNYDNLDDYTVFLQGNPFDHSPNIIQDLLSFVPNIDFKFLSSVTHRCKNSYCPYKPHANFIEVYDRLFDDHHTETILEFGEGAQFIISKELILSKPKSFYLKIIDLLGYSINPIEGHVIERFHRIILDDKYKKESEALVASGMRISFY